MCQLTRSQWIRNELLPPLAKSAKSFNNFLFNLRHSASSASSSSYNHLQPNSSLCCGSNCCITCGRHTHTCVPQWALCRRQTTSVIVLMTIESTNLITRNYYYYICNEFTGYSYSSEQECDWILSQTFAKQRNRNFVYSEFYILIVWLATLCQVLLLWV